MAGRGAGAGAGTWTPSDEIEYCQRRKPAAGAGFVMDLSRTVLVVAPEFPLRQSLSSALASGGYLIHAAPTEQAAYNEMRRHRYPVAVCERPEEQASGAEFVRRVREIQPDARVILCGGNRATALECLREQAFAFFRTPYSGPALSDMVGHAFEPDGWRQDITLESATLDWVTLSVRARFPAGERAAQFFRELADELPPAKAEDLASAVREILLNAIEYGGRKDAGQKVRLTFIRTSRAVLCSIQDPGEGFALEAIPHAAVSNPPGDRLRHAEVREEKGLRPGGFGILMARDLVDDLLYNQKGNEVLLVKYRTNAAAG